MNNTALIVTFNRLDKLKECWSATKPIGFDHIVIVDNASNDGTREWLQALDDPRLTVLLQEQNQGGAGGFKLGAAFLAENISTDWVFFYDDDSWPPADALARFAAIGDQRWGAYCCKVVDKQNRLCKMNLPYINLPHTALRDITYMAGGTGFAPDGESVMEVSSFSFVGLIISGDMLKRSLHYLLPELFIYFDDLYFSYHLKLIGCNIRYSPEIVFTHDIVPHANGVEPSWKIYYLIRNLLLSRHFFSADRPYSNGAIVIRIIKYILMVRKQSCKKEYLGYMMKAICDGISFKTGKRH